MPSIKHIFGDDQPGHTTPVALRVVYGRIPGTPEFVGASVVRIHGNQLQTFMVLAVLLRDGVTDIDLLDIDGCTEAFDCAHSYWALPLAFTATQLVTALAALPGTRGVPYTEPVLGTG